MALFTHSQLPFTQLDITGLNELYFQKAFSLPEIKQLHNVITGIKGNKQIGIVGRIPMVGKAKSGCEFTADNKVIPLTEKLWTPKKLEIALSQCVDDFEDESSSMFWTWLEAAGKDNPDLTMADGWLAFIAEQLMEALPTTVLRHAWFGDTDAANYEDSPAGVITNTSNPAYFNVIDGFWKQIFAIAAADTDRLYDITENEGASYAAQALAAGKALTTFRNLRENADDRLYEDESAVILCTKSMALNYNASLSGTGVESSFKRIEGGYQTLQYDGVPVIAVPFFDRIIREHYNNGTVHFRPHRAVYVSPSNLAIGLEENDSFSSYREWHSEDEGEYRLRALWKMDAKVLIDNQIQVAY